MSEGYKVVKDKKLDFKKDAKIISFHRDVNYYYQKGNHYFLKNNFKKALLFFKKIVEIEPDNALNHYNLACLMSKMGQLEEANRLFAYIVDELDTSLSECYFLMAINYGLMDELEDAQKYLHLYLENQPEGEMAAEARELLWALDDNEGDYQEYYYQETIPIEEEKDFVEKKEEIIKEINNLNQEEIREIYEHSEFFRHIIKKILYYSRDTEKEQIIRLFGSLNNLKAKETILEFVRNPWAKDRLKLLAMLKLKNMKPPNSCQVYLKGKIQEINLQQYPIKAYRWEEKWEKVLVCVMNNMRKNKDLNNEKALLMVLTLWLKFINKTYPQVPKVIKPETWAAGLEYSLVRHYYLKMSQREISKKYGVSAGSVREKYCTIIEMVDLKKVVEGSLLD